MGAQQKNSVGVLLVDDCPVVRQGLRALIDAEPDLQVIGESGTETEAISLAQRLSPTVVLIDIDVSERSLDGFEVAREVKRTSPAVGVLFLTQHDSRSIFFESLRAGAGSFLSKSADGPELMEAIRTVAQGRVYITPATAHWLLDEFLARTKTRRRAKSTHELTSREHQILQLVADGMTNQEIAKLLSISFNTVRRHRANLMEKLGFHNQMALLRYAMGMGLVHAEA